MLFSVFLYFSVCLLALSFFLFKAWIAYLFVMIALMIPIAILVRKGAFTNHSVLAVGTIVILAWSLVGIYFGSYARILSLVGSGFGIVLSIPIMIFFFFFKEGRKPIDVTLVQVKEEKLTLKQRIQATRDTIQHLRNLADQIIQKKREGNTWLYAIQYVYVEQSLREKGEDEEAHLTFYIFKEVQLVQSEVDSTKI